MKAVKQNGLQMDKYVKADILSEFVEYKYKFWYRLNTILI